MKISISYARGATDPKFHTRFFSAEVKGQAFLDHVTSSVWSPLAWKDGKRANVNFADCSMLALDFDSGVWDIETAINYLKKSNIRGLIGTTKSHQKEKTTKSGVVSPACDRFRMFMTIDRPFLEADRYSFQMRLIELQFPTDKSCKDLARFFYPCKEIVYVGGEVPYKTLSDDEYLRLKEEQELRRQLTHKKRKGLKKQGMLPSFIMNVLQFGAPEGKRHVTAYRVGAELYKFGWDFEETYAYLAETNLIDIGENDLERAIQNGRDAAESLIDGI